MQTDRFQPQSLLGFRSLWKLPGGVVELYDAHRPRYSPSLVNSQNRWCFAKVSGSHWCQHHWWDEGWMLVSWHVKSCCLCHSQGWPWISHDWSHDWEVQGEVAGRGREQSPGFSIWKHIFNVCYFLLSGLTDPLKILKTTPVSILVCRTWLLLRAKRDLCV